MVCLLLFTYRSQFFTFIVYFYFYSSLQSSFFYDIIEVRAKYERNASDNARISLLAPCLGVFSKTFYTISQLQTSQIFFSEMP